MKLITNFIICLLIAFTSNAINVALVFAQDESKSKEPSDIITIESSNPNDDEVIYKQN